MHYWHVPGAWQHFLWVSRWAARSLILNLWLYFARPGKMLEDTRKSLGGCGRGTSFTPGQKPRIQGCLKIWFCSAFPVVAAGPVSGCLFQCGGQNCCISFAFLVSSHWGERHVFKWAGVYFHKPQAFLCGWKSCKTSESYFLWHELLCLKNAGNNFLFRLKQMKLLQCSDVMVCMKQIFGPF